MSAANRFNDVSLIKELIRVDLTDALRSWVTVNQVEADDNDFNLTLSIIRAWTSVNMLMIRMDFRIETNGNIAPNKTELNLDTNLPHSVIAPVSNSVMMTRTSSSGEITYVSGILTIFEKRITIKVSPFKSNSTYTFSGQIFAEVIIES